MEDDQETWRGTNDDVPGPVPDNPPGLWGRQSGQDVSIGVEDQVPDFRGWITRISGKKHERIIVKSWPKCQDFDVWRSNVVQAVSDPDTASWRTWFAPAQMPGPDHACGPTQAISGSNLLTPS